MESGSQLSQKKMARLLDCTLRDGAHVNSGLFGDHAIREIASNLLAANVDLVEIGFLVNRSRRPGSTYFESINQVESVLEGIEADNRVAIMVRPDWFPRELLTQPGRCVTHIRIAFRESDARDAIVMAQSSIELGFKVHLNPIATPTVSDAVLSEIFQFAAEGGVETLSIVDTYGMLTGKSLSKLLNQFTDGIPPGAWIGLHLHQNLNMALNLVQTAFNTMVSQDRKFSVDASLLGMGRVPGNLEVESAAIFMNETIGSSYDTLQLLEASSKLIAPIKEAFGWGYDPMYALSAFLGLDRTFPEKALESLGRDVDQIQKVLRRLARQSHVHYSDEWLKKALEEKS